MLDTAARLFYARGVHEVGMDELGQQTGLGKATVYRLFPTKDALVGAYLQRLAVGILAEMDAQAGLPPARALHDLLVAVEGDLSRPGFRGCAFNNASIEYDDPQHPGTTAPPCTPGCTPTLSDCCPARRSRPRPSPVNSRP